MTSDVVFADPAAWIQAATGTLALIIAVLSGVVGWRKGKKAERRQALEQRLKQEAEKQAGERAQAEKIRAMWGNNPADAGDTELGEWGAIVSNDSSSPITYVNLTVRHRREKWTSKNDRDTVAGHSKDKWSAQKVYANIHGGLGLPKSAVMPDDERLPRLWQERNMHLIELLFQDQDERFWRRDENRRLHELASELVVWVDDERLESCRAHIYNEFVPRFGITPKFELYPTTEDLQDRFNEYVASPPAGASLPDIMVGPHDWVGGLVTSGSVDEVQLSADQREAFYPEAIAALSQGGKLYGIPYAFDTAALISNVELTGDAPIPATFAELLAHGEELCRQHGLDLPIAVQMGPRGDPYHHWPMFSSAGGTLAGLRGDGTFAERADWEDGFVEGFAAIAKLGVAAGPGVLNPELTRDAAEAAFLLGRTPYLIAACSRLGDVLERGMSVNTSTVPPLGPLPARSFVTVLAFYLSPYGSNRHIAHDLVAYYLAKRDAAIQLNLIQPWPPVQVEATDVVKVQTPQLSAYVEARESGLLMPTHPGMRAVWDAFGKAQVEAVRAQRDPRTIALELADYIQRILN